MKKKSLFQQLLLAAMMCVSLTVSAQVMISAGTVSNAVFEAVAECTIPADIIPPRVNRADLTGSAHGTNQTNTIVYVNILGGTASGSTATQVLTDSTLADAGYEKVYNSIGNNANRIF